ncbi:Nudix hydrolase 15, mitochondrial [Entomortierella lignicola]|nr:Nudix hydrolase 15, mitochondrial [Entomortierella lignicola]
MAGSDQVVGVGVGVWIIHEHKALIGKRIGSLCPGEAQEETGLDLDPATVKFVTANNNVMPDVNKHYITIFMSANVKGSHEAKIMEPEKCENWVWVTLEELLDDNGPYRPLFAPLENLIKESDLSPLFA